MWRAEQPASTRVAGPYGQPYHPMLVTVPIGTWLASLMFDLASHLVRDSGFLTQGSEWLIATGVVGAIAAAVAGFIDLAAIPIGTAAFRIARVHMCINLMVTFAYAGNFAWRYRTYHHPAPVGVGMLALSAACVAALGVSGYLGGKLVYRYGVRVAAGQAIARADRTTPPIAPEAKRGLGR